MLPGSVPATVAAGVAVNRNCSHNVLAHKSVERTERQQQQQTNGKQNIQRAPRTFTHNFLHALSQKALITLIMCVCCCCCSCCWDP